MLVLSRKVGERIVIPNYDLTVTIIAVDGNRVRLGVAAPTDVNVYREELWVHMQDHAHGASPQG